MSRRAWGMLVIVVVAVLLGALREFLFINLNYQIDHLEHGRAYSYAHSKFQRLVAGIDLQGLVILKWVWSGAYVLIMLILGILLSRLLFGDHRYAYPIVIGYIIIGILALLFHGISSGADAWYNIGVKLLHALQYPVILIFIWGAAQLAAFRR
jgi:cell division protein FtsW (lipid II flippase)